MQYEQFVNAQQAEMLGTGVIVQLASPVEPDSLAEHLSAALFKVLATNIDAGKAQHFSRLQR